MDKEQQPQITGPISSWRVVNGMPPIERPEGKIVYSGCFGVSLEEAPTDSDKLSSSAILHTYPHHDELIEASLQAMVPYVSDSRFVGIILFQEWDDLLAHVCQAQKKYASLGSSMLHKLSQAFCYTFTSGASIYFIPLSQLDSVRSMEASSIQLVFHQSDDPDNALLDMLRSRLRGKVVIDRRIHLYMYIQRLQQHAPMKGFIEGRNVHYVAYNNRHLAALIIGCHPDNAADLAVFSNLENAAGKKNYGLQFHEAVAYSKNPQPGTWHWIERA